MYGPESGISNNTKCNIILEASNLNYVVLFHISHHYTFRRHSWLFVGYNERRWLMKTIATYKPYKISENSHQNTGNLTFFWSFRKKKYFTFCLYFFRFYACDSRKSIHTVGWTIREFIDVIYFLMKNEYEQTSLGILTSGWIKCRI